ncbi:YqzK family protein [Anoxybacillus kestanbolensis]|uniref:YqzK family protein n=1 Tax=Anoxybacillus kestanbolensis TaxID=227476 RepID=UPI003D249F80
MKRIVDVLKVFLLFTGCTILFYYSIVWMSEEYNYYRRYDEPMGSAVKVSTTEQQETYWLDRLLFFYQNGE